MLLYWIVGCLKERMQAIELEAEISAFLVCIVKGNKGITSPKAGEDSNTFLRPKNSPLTLTGQIAIQTSIAVFDCSFLLRNNFLC